MWDGDVKDDDDDMNDAWGDEMEDANVELDYV
jgi:hypothetical protein